VTSTFKDIEFPSATEIEQQLQVPLLGCIEEVAPDGAADKLYPTEIFHYPVTRPSSRFSNSIGLLREAIQMIASGETSKKVILITSTVSGEGKSTISCSIATSAAQSGLSVLLIDGSVRNPKLSNRLRFLTPPGFAEVLSGTAAFERTLRKSADLGFTFLPGGTKALDPATVLSSGRLKRVLENARAAFDFVVIDMPPAGLVPDAFVVSALSDTLLYLWSPATTPREAVCYTVKQLSRYKKITGIAFNRGVLNASNCDFRLT